MRGYDEDKKRAENTRENRRSRDSREYNDRDYHRNERKKIKGRGRMHYKPQFSRYYVIYLGRTRQPCKIK